MTPNQLKDWMKKNQKTLADIESLTRVSSATIRRFLSGETTMHAANLKALETLVKFYGQKKEAQYE